MEKTDLNQIKLEDTGIFEKYKNNFSSILKNNDITTVGQVLDDNLMHEIMKKCKTKTRIELRGFIALLKYKYLEIPLSNKDILEQRPEKDMSPRYNYNINEPEYFYPIDFSELGLHKSYKLALKYEVRNLKKEKIENKQLIEFIKEIINSEKYCGAPEFIEILRLHVESYDKSKQLTQPTINQETQTENKNTPQLEHDILVILKDQLVKLVGVRDSLDAQIEDIQQKIDALTNSKTEGGVSK